MKFWKMSGAGNDFVLLTGGPRPARELAGLARRLCARKISIGADGLLYARRSGAGALAVRYFNSDGSEAFCGNGSRCAALWARSAGLAGKSFTLRTLAGDLEARVTGPGTVEMEMPPVSGARLRLPGSYPAGIRTVHFLDTGVPHAVVPVRGLDRIDVTGLGREIRRNRAFGPAGANVNFTEIRRGGLYVRTYERGVEAETLACGTGITASAVALALAGELQPPVRAESRGGDGFTVRFVPVPGGASGVRLTGPARIVFKGEISC